MVNSGQRRSNKKRSQAVTQRERENRAEKGRGFRKQKEFTGDY